MVFMLAVTLVTSVSLFSGNTAVTAEESMLWAFLLGPVTGSYILVAVVAFVTGILVSVVAQKYRNRKRAIRKGDRDGKRTSQR